MLTYLSVLASRLRALLSSRRDDADFQQELASHLAMLTDENIRRGMTPTDAARAARLRLGSDPQLREAHHDLRVPRFIETLWQDVRYAARILRKSPGFTAVAILTLALGIGANTAVFSLLDAIIFRTLPVPNPHQLVFLSWNAQRAPRSNSFSTSGPCPEKNSRAGGCWFPYPLFQEIASHPHPFAGVFASFDTGTVDLTFHGNASRAQGTLVSGGFFSTMGARAVIGRTIEPTDDSLAAAPAITLAYDYWQRQFAGDSSIIGQTVYVNRHPFTITGVATSGFFGFDAENPADFWVPLSYESAVGPSFLTTTDPLAYWLRIGARIKPGLSISQAQALIDPLFIRDASAGPAAIFKPDSQPHLQLANLARGLDSARQDYSTILLRLMALVGIVLLLACANIAGLGLARCAARQKETTVRRTLGASPWRLVRQLLTESLLLAGAGGAVGILLAYWAAGFLVSFLSVNSSFPLQIDTRPDLRALTFTIAISVIVGILSGLAPALTALRADLIPVLKKGGPFFSQRSRRRWFSSGNALVVSQVALSILLLAGAGLLLRSLSNRESVKLGFDEKNLLTFGVDTTLTGLKDSDAANLYQDLRRQFRELPAVARATYSMKPPLTNFHSGGLFQAPGLPSTGKWSFFDKMQIGPDFFQTMGIPLIAGRAFTPEDFSFSGSPTPLIANQQFVRKYFGERNALGALLSIMGQNSEGQIVGVAADASFDNTSGGTTPILYSPFQSGPVSFEIRTTKNPKPLIPLIRGTVRRAAANLLLTNVTTVTDQIKAHFSEDRLDAGLFSLFALLALLLACIGLYGFLAHEVSRRTREIGIRVALGAHPRDLLRLVLGRGLFLATVGAVLGIAVVVVFRRFLAHELYLYGVKAVDPLTLAAVAALLLIVALAACYIPARRAMRVDPATALRSE